MKITFKTRALWKMSPQKKELLRLRQKLREQTVNAQELARWAYLEAIQKEMDKPI